MPCYITTFQHRGQRVFLEQMQNNLLFRIHTTTHPTAKQSLESMFSKAVLGSPQGKAQQKRLWALIFRQRTTKAFTHLSEACIGVLFSRPDNGGEYLRTVGSFSCCKERVGSFKDVSNYVFTP